MISDFIKINGQNMPEPFGFSVREEDLDGENTTRTEDGNLHRDRIWSKAQILSLSYNAIPQQEMTLLLQAIEPPEISVDYFSPEHTRKTINAYAGGRTTVLIEGTMDKVQGGLWTVSFDIIESRR